MNNPQVTFVLVCYNHGDFVAESIHSVLQQTYNNVQLVVVDDHSTDHSHAVISKLREQYPFTYIRHEQNMGLNNAILSGLQAATGAYISILASDDFVTPDKTAVQVAFLQKMNKHGVYSTGYTYQEGEKEIIKIHSVFKQPDKQKVLDYIYQYDWGVPLQQSSLLHRDIMFGLIDLRKQYKSDDWAFIIKVYENFDVAYLDCPVFYYRLHGTNTHKKYWFTFPMRLDIASRLVPDAYRVKTTGNIFLSQSQYLFNDKRYVQSVKFFLASMILNFSLKNIYMMIRTVGGSVKAGLRKKN